MKLSKKAVQYAEDNYIDVDIDDMREFIAEALEQPGDAYFRDEELYVTHTLAFHTPAWHLTDDYIIDQANYRDALDILEPLGAEAATVGHWTYSTFECIKVPVLNSKGNVTSAAVELWNLVQNLRDYPLINDETHSELEMEVNNEAMKQAIEWEEHQREIEFSDWQKQKIEEIYWEDYYGYHEAGYIEDEKFQGVVDDVLSGNVQEHQEVSLF